MLKFTQLILGELLAGALCLACVYVCILGISGNTNPLVPGRDLKARLTNGAPGVMITIIGVALAALPSVQCSTRPRRRGPRAAALDTRARVA
jgi:hypothetical protein